MELIYVDGSPFARLVRILIREWELPVTTREVPFPLPPDVETLTPMGQVPLLLNRGDEPCFPTLRIVDTLLPLVTFENGVPINDRQRALLPVALTAGDALVQAAYQEWAGLESNSANALGFDPAARNLGRFNRSVEWLHERVEVLSIVGITMAVFLDWARNRAVVGVDLTTAAAGDFLTLTDRPSFRSTVPRPFDR